MRSGVIPSQIHHTESRESPPSVLEANGAARDDGIAEVARNLKRLGMAIDLIIQATRLTTKEVEGLKTGGAASISTHLAGPKGAGYLFVAPSKEASTPMLFSANSRMSRPARLGQPGKGRCLHA